MCVIKAEAFELGCDGEGGDSHAKRREKQYQALGIGVAMAVRWEGSRVKANTCVLLTINKWQKLGQTLSGD